MKCPKCRRDIPDNSVECPECEIVIAKYQTRFQKRRESVQTQKTNSKMKNCPDCGHEVSYRAKSCPNCGSVFPKKSGAMGCLGIIMMVFLAIWVYDKFNKATNPRVEPTQAEQAASKAERDRIKAEEYEKCKLTLECWGNKHDFHAIAKAEDLIEKMAKYQSKWTDGILDSKLTKFKWLDIKKLTVTYLGDKIQFQNGFGAWENMIYECDYDPINDKILDVRVRPGRL